MNKIFIGFIICLYFLNCGKKEEKIVVKNIPYIISQENKEKILNGDTIPPPPIPGWLVYGSNTFIIDSDSKIYYFQRNEIGFICGTGSQNDTVPHFINLQPKDLIEISNNNISDFVKLNYKDNFRNITFISSKTDTLKSKNFFQLIKSLKSSIKDRDLYFVRRTTQEEDTVLKYKKNNNYYRSDDIKWDKNRITFPLIKPTL